MALCHIIKDDGKLDFEEKLKYIKNWSSVLKLGPEFGVKTGISASTLLFACISLYHNVDPMKIVQMFEEYQSGDDNVLNYRVSGDDCKFTIDVHCFNHLQVQFLLRYIIGFQLHEFDLDERNGLDLIVGKSKHGIKGLDTKYSLKDFVMDDLLKYDPPIKCELHSNSGLLFIPKDQLLPYLSDDANYAKLKLTVPSNDWYLTDPRVEVS